MTHFVFLKWMTCHDGQLIKIKMKVLIYSFDMDLSFVRLRSSYSVCRSDDVLTSCLVGSRSSRDGLITVVGLVEDGQMVLPKKHLQFYQAVSSPRGNRETECRNPDFPPLDT